MSWPVPAVDDLDRAYWTGGADGQLLIQRCTGCRTWVHPPGPVCMTCWTATLVPEPVSGRATLLTWSTNEQAWTADLPVPYTVAVVELPEQSGLRLVTRLLDLPESALSVGAMLAVRFEQHEDVWLPLFGPA